MSYDLYFYKNKNSKLTEEQISIYLNENFLLNNSEIKTQWSYENEYTGVYFSIDWNEPETENEEIEFWDNFVDFKYLNFNFTINFIRPNFFGYESFPVLEKIIKDLDLFILNPQDENNSDIPQKYDKGYFEKQWLHHNEVLIKENFENFQVEYFPLEMSDYIWKYHFNRADLQERVTGDVFVAGYFLLKKKTDGKLYRFCVWPNHIPIIFPPVDYVIIQKEYRKFFNIIKETGIVSFEKIINEFGKYLDNFESEFPNLKILKPHNAKKIRKEFNAMNLECKVEEFGNLVTFDGFVNVRPELTDGRNGTSYVLN